MNKKLIKKISTIALGLVVFSSVPCFVSSCKQNNTYWKSNFLPRDVFNVETVSVPGQLQGATILRNFVSDFDESQYADSGIDTMCIPASVDIVDFSGIIPSYIKTLSFEKGSGCFQFKGFNTGHTFNTVDLTNAINLDTDEAQDESVNGIFPCFDRNTSQSGSELEKIIFPYTNNAICFHTDSNDQWRFGGEALRTIEFDSLSMMFDFYGNEQMSFFSGAGKQGEDCVVHVKKVIGTRDPEHIINDFATFAKLDKNIWKPKRG